MGLPKTVQVGSACIRVRQLAKVVCDDGEECEGIYRSDKNEIQIEKSLNDDRKWQTLVHEMVHASLDHAGLVLQIAKLAGDESEALEEAIAVAVCSQFVGALRSHGWLKFPGDK